MVPISMVTNLKERLVEENSVEDQVWMKIVVGMDQIILRLSNESILFSFPKPRN